MANVTRYYLADFGPRYTGLATVGYTLPGGSRATSGVSELAAGTGAYGAEITHDSSLTGALKWDTGGGSPVYAFDEINPSGSSGSSSSGGGGTSSAPALSLLDTVYCTDEDILLRAPQDYVRLCPASQVLASASDGEFAENYPWDLASASTDFEAQGIGQGHVVALTSPRSTFPTPGGVLMVVSSVADTTATLRRPGVLNGYGQPPAPTDGVNSVAFSVLTFGPQIDNASYDANQFFGIDPASSDRPPSRLYDRRELQQYTVLTVLRRAYIAAEKTAAGDFRLKLEDVTREMDELRARLVVRWGSTRDSEPPTSAFTARIRR